jgi:murein DD-endopeptidase MepM/ murein hydrolase activator NlpD
MSLRKSFPKARLPDTHYFITLSRGEKMRSYAVRPGLLYAFGGCAPLLAAGFVAATAYHAFRDDMLARLMSRQAEMQYAYEDRIAGLRAQMDRVTSRQLLDQNSFDGKIHDLISRQAQLESRGALVAQLAAQVGVATEPKGEAKTAPSSRLPANPLLTGKAAALPTGALGFAPLDAGKPSEAGKAPKPSPVKPSPLRGAEEASAQIPGLSSRGSGASDPSLGLSALTATSLDVEELAQAPAPEKLGRIAASLDSIELTQARQLAAVEAKARNSAAALRQVFADAGLSVDKLSPPAGATAGVGGPFIPLKVDANGSPFERQIARLQDALAQADKLRRLAVVTPLRFPLGSSAEQTSPFGARVDPFLGRAAMHAGLDFRDEHGAPVKVTAAGRVVAAGWQGGYGNMVEVEHGNGLSTRYAHLSAILVSEGDRVAPGAVVGRLGSTGRSTGPHLHYEVRVDGEAVDPVRFLRAGRAMFGRGAPEKLEL